MITRAIENCLKMALTKWWDKTYWGIDIHETMMVPNYDGDRIPTKWYPFAKDAMTILSKRKDVCLFLYTCSHPGEIGKYLDFFKKAGIDFEYANENPEVPNDAYGFYRNKPYWNVLFEDKAGFDPIEWTYVIDKLNEYPERDWSDYKTHFYMALSECILNHERYFSDEFVANDRLLDKFVEILRGEYSPYKDYKLDDKLSMIHLYLEENGYEY